MVLLVRFCALAVLLLFPSLSLFSQDLPAGPKLLLTPQRLRRLQRDRERQTVRWTNFENRVRTTADSAERGFELALYYAVTHDEQSGREAIEWAIGHRCEARQVALIRDWCRAAGAEDRLREEAVAACDRAPNRTGLEALRDDVFQRIASGSDKEPLAMNRFTPLLAQFYQQITPSAEDVYALCEIIDAVRGFTHVDLREGRAEFFAHLPTEFLLGMKPQQVDSPTWRTRTAGQILVAIDPNLQESQFLQGWAMEQRQMIAQGDGVAYEFLWGNPYLPGVSYQNLDPWAYYETSALLFARSDWSPNACWISISPNQVQALQCPTEWRRQEARFGRLTLMPVLSSCVQVPAISGNGDAVILWGLRPGQKITYRTEDKPQSREADGAGLLRVPSQVQGKVCVSKSHE